MVLGSDRGSVGLAGTRQAQFPKASAAGNNRVVFNITGNADRLIVSFSCRHHAGYIKFFGTHAEYDRIDAATVDHTGAVHGKKHRRN